MRALRIFSKELRDYFVSPIAYIVISVFLLVTGWFFFSPFFIFDQASLRDFFNLLPPVFSFIIPAMTMRLFSEEFNTGSYEILETLPVNGRDIILGKFLAVAALVAALLVPTLSYAVSVSLLGDLDWGPVAGGYIGALFLGGAYGAIGLFASSLTKNQIVAFIIGAALCFALTLVNKMVFFFPSSVASVLGFLGADAHFQNIARGVLDSRDILYFVSIMFLGLYGTSAVLEARK
ncbi:MAG TPA: ABC transporter permease subunit [Syntrophales bacterium]|nr:ABC transporter permease subunit [Syntrophales bacterium]HQN78742.1 ABC transporter permease subunit [Syntrophales bacterium]HQQ27120.1 ABC transporter permease subunit [Syntrophales bacterium]